MKIWWQRHGFAGPRSGKPKKDDARPLVAEGQKAVAAIADRMDDMAEWPLVVYASPLPRARMTAQIMSDALGAGNVQVIPQLARDQDILDWFRSVILKGRVKRALIVGHSDNIPPALADLNGGKLADVDAFVMGEVRRLKMDPESGRWVERYRIQPADAGFTNRL